MAGSRQFLCLGLGKALPEPDVRPERDGIRPLYEMADFGEVVTPEVAAIHDRVREKTEGH